MKHQNDESKVNWGRLFLLGGGPLLLAILFAVVAGDAREMVKTMRMESGCDKGDWGSCGYLALMKVRDGTTYEDMTRGMELMKGTCEHDYDGACRMAATFQGRRVPTFGGTTMRVLRNHRNPILAEKCIGGNSKACFAAAHLTGKREKRFTENKRRKLEKAAREQCGASDDMHACRAASLLASGLRIESKEAHLRACAHGFADSCGAMWAGTPIPELTEEERAAMRSTCEETGSLLACRQLAEAGQPELFREMCWNSEFEQCMDVEIADDDPNANIRALFYTPISKLSDGDYVGYSFGKVAGQTATACEEGLPEACFLEGIKLVNELYLEWVPEERPSSADLEATFGRACELGMNAGCLAIGIELLNRPPEQREVATANKWLDQGCERGNTFSCWVRNRDEELRAGKNAATAKASLKACKYSTVEQSAQSACAFYVGVLEHELEATPWVMSDRRMAAMNVEHCWKDNLPKACRDLGWAWDLRKRPTDSELPGGLVFAAYADVENGCRMRNLATCQMMFDAADTRWPVIDDGRTSTLRTRVCAALPEVCRGR